MNNHSAIVQRCPARFLAALALGWLSLVTPLVASPSVLAIRNVAVVDVEIGKLLRNQTVLLDGERITRIGPTQTTIITGDAMVVDGEGLFLLPGLIDAHVHYINPQTFGPMLIAHGVTLIRDTGGATGTVLALREQLRTGELLGPEMLCTGAIIDGDPPVWPFSEVCSNPDQARAAVRKLANAGVDQIKVYSMLNKESYVAAVAEAHVRGLKAIGHVPLSVSLSEAIDAGQDGIEHLDGFDELIARAAGQEVPRVRSFGNMFARWDLYPKADQRILHTTYELLKARNITICPTIVVMKGIGQAANPDESNPWLDYVPEFMRGFWRAGRYAQMAPGSRRVVPLMQSVILELHKAGVNLICGTDLANPYVFAGHSLHEEMQLFQDAGIPATDVLRSATIASAKFLGVADRLGSIAEGKTASMFLTRKNPLEDIRNVSEIAGVFLRGRFFDRGKLDDLLAEARTFAAGTRNAAPQTVDMSLAGRVIRRGTYRSTFNNLDAGKEDFVITKTDDGFSLKAHAQPLGGFQQPSFMTAHFDASRRVREISWQQLTDRKLSVTYTFSEKAATAKARTGDTDLPIQRIDLPEHWLLSGPFTALQFADKTSAPQAVNETKSFDALGFGFAGWKIAVSKYAVTRKNDRTLKMPDGREIKTRFYTSELQLPMGTFTGQTWTDDAGVVLKSTLTMPFGTSVVTLE